MKTEKVILSFIAVLVGILVTGGAFYLYQSTKTPSQTSKKIVISKPTPTPQPSVFLTIKNPQDEGVVSKRVVPISGTTSKDATVVIISPLDQEVLSPTSGGDFSTTINIDDGENLIEITAISSAGEETTITRAVTFSTEEF